MASGKVLFCIEGVNAGLRTRSEPKNKLVAVAVPIPDYALYGEPQDKQFAERLHIETVPERSAVHGWSIHPHRHHGLYQLFWIDSGGGELQIEDTRFPLCPPLAIFIPPLVVHGFEFHPGTDGFVASFPVATLGEVLAPSVQAALDTALLLPHRRLPDSIGNPKHLFADALTEHSEDLPGRPEALHAHAALLGIWFLRASGTASGLGRTGAQTRALLLRRFVEVVERRFAEQPSVAKIAKELGVSAPYLTRVCRELLGRPAERPFGPLLRHVFEVEGPLVGQGRLQADGPVLLRLLEDPV